MALCGFVTPTANFLSLLPAPTTRICKGTVIGLEGAVKRVRQHLSLKRRLHGCSRSSRVPLRGGYSYPVGISSTRHAFYLAIVIPSLRQSLEKLSGFAQRAAQTETRPQTLDRQHLDLLRQEPTGVTLFKLRQAEPKLEF